MNDHVSELLARMPVVDGHNDLPHVIREAAAGDVGGYPVRSGAPGHTDLARLRAGGIGAQFWAVYVPCGVGQDGDPGPADWAVDQFGVVRALEAALSDALEAAWSVAEIERAWRMGRIASLIGVEGGHAIEGSLDHLRRFRRLGARYLTLTHNCTNGWADSATDVARYDGLSEFGCEVVRELNRLGMLVDLSHASPDAMRQAIEVSEAPVAFTHSCARALTDHPRNVPDDVLESIGRTGGIVMVTFVPRFVSERVRTWLGDPEEAPRADVSDVADHIEHVRAVAGLDHVGIGGDLDGTPALPLGLEDASRYPALIEELLGRGWEDEALEALAGRNILRVLSEAERVSQGTI